MYDFLIVGAGFYGAICAYELEKLGFKCVVIDKRNFIGGNCHTSKMHGIDVHDFGPHIFHTSSEVVWNWINQFASFNNFTLRPVANYKGEIFSLPFNMWTFSKLWGITSPQEAREIIKNQSNGINVPKNLEEQAIKMVGTDIYHKLIKGYTEKQWQKSAKELPVEIIKRLPVRFTYDNNYFNDPYQGIPTQGYTSIFENLLDDIDLRLGCDFFKSKLPNYKNLIYTGPIDLFYNYKYGPLEYKTLRFNHKILNVNDFQGTAMMNFTSDEVPFTRIVEHKHFNFKNTTKSVITEEFPVNYIAGKTEPYYPVNDTHNNSIYEKYRKLTKRETNIYFGGRLAEYKYYDMDKVISSALNFITNLSS